MERGFRIIGVPIFCDTGGQHTTGGNILRDSSIPTSNSNSYSINVTDIKEDSLSIQMFNDYRDQPPTPKN